MGLLVFSITSGYFTAERYSPQVSWKYFWRRKITRLYPALLIIDVFLLLLFVVQGRDGIWTWHTIVNVIGLNGFLNWFHITNPSPFGAGMWFLTALLVFYAVYPILISWFYKFGNSTFSLLAFIVLILFLLQQIFPYGHALWLTLAGFPTGVYFSIKKPALSKSRFSLVIFLSLVGMCSLHYFFHFDLLNFFFMYVVASTAVLFLQTINLPQAVTIIGAFLSSLLLEIYLLHPYLRLHMNSNVIFEVFVSMVLTIVVSYMLVTLRKVSAKRFGG